MLKGALLKENIVDLAICRLETTAKMVIILSKIMNLAFTKHGKESISDNKWNQKKKMEVEFLIQKFKSRPK